MWVLRGPPSVPSCWISMSWPETHTCPPVTQRLGSSPFLVYSSTCGFQFVKGEKQAPYEFSPGRGECRRVVALQS